MKKMILGAAALVVAVVTAFSVSAAPIPPAVDAMLRAAGGDIDTVARVAKIAHPDSTAEIDALTAQLAAQREEERTARLAQAGFFDAWSGEGELGMYYTTGNTKDIGAVVSIGLTKEGLEFRHKVNALVDRQKSGGVMSRSRSLLDYELNYKFNERLYLYGLVGWERNTFAGFAHRFTESGGFGYSVFNRERLILDVTAGPAFQQTQNVGARREHETTVRAAVDFGWVITDNLKLTESAAILLGTQWTSTTALTYAFNEALSSRASFDVIYENDPLPGRKAADTATRLSLVYGF